MRAAVLSVILTASLGAQGRLTSDPGVAGDYLLGAGDLVRVDVFEVEELSGALSVAEDGTVDAALIGQVPAAGKTAAELEREIERRLAQDLLNDPQVTVVVEEYRSQPVSVVGAVQEPGVYQLRGRRRLADVLALAGGLAQEAGERVVLLRGGEGEGRRIRIRDLHERPSDDDATP